MVEIESLLHPRKLSTSSRRNNRLNRFVCGSLFFACFFLKGAKKVLHLVMRKRMRRKPRLALKRLIFFFIFFLLDIYLLQNSLFTSNNISHSNCYVRELSLWKPAFPPQMGFLLFRLIPTFTTNATAVHFQLSKNCEKIGFASNVFPAE